MRKRQYVKGLAYPVDEIVRILKLNTLTCEEIAVMFEYSESNIKRIARLYKNKNKADNRWHNLQLMTNADHLALHREERSARCKANKV